MFIFYKQLAMTKKKKNALPREVGCFATLITDNVQSKYPQGHSQPQCRFRKWEGSRV
jgi:hypothetical protein